MQGWSVEWLMLFNADKCKSMHNNRQYDIVVIKTSHEEKDFDVIIAEMLEVTEQCAKASNKV